MKRTQLLLWLAVSTPAVVCANPFMLDPAGSVAAEPSTVLLVIAGLILIARHVGLDSWLKPARDRATSEDDNSRRPTYE
ncbi:MAG: hypothetical protein ACRD8O_11655 [Bryobacteraceae bacterium]